MPATRLRVHLDGPIPADRIYLRLMAWGNLWSVPSLPDRVRVLYSDGLRAYAALSRPEQREIVLNRIYLSRHPSETDSVLCHQAAHVALYLLEGPGVPLHGVEWRSLLRRAGCHATQFCGTEDPYRDPAPGAVVGLASPTTALPLRRFLRAS